MSGLSPKLPLSRTSDDGYWGLNKTFLETTKQNFKNLLLTNPGERVMDPFFGVGLMRYLFSQEGELIKGNIEAKIDEQANTYLRHIIILEVQIVDASQSSQLSPNSYFIKITYRITPLNKNDILEITIDADKTVFNSPELL
tara:strand:- start:107 stop:529 length:423 start_codon:yes stop_codon:yes gene_type:complete